MPRKSHPLMMEFLTWAFFAALSLGLALPLVLKEHHLSLADILAPPDLAGQIRRLSFQAAASPAPVRLAAVSPRSLPSGNCAELAPNLELLDEISGRSRPGLSWGPSLATYEDMIAATARQHQVSPLLVKAVIQAESGFNPRAISHRGAVGLMQVMPSTARSMGVNDYADPQKNIQAGVKYLKILLEQFNDDERLAVAAYNCGPEVLKRFGNQVPPYRETQNFVERVMNYYNQHLES
ncbi:MAG: lytic transglycosylase domain-containing protein [Candidatus Adiutrix sp.]|jgi:soluble lytic murein transglycosylase-like protein|nr:lytic transglycosylase domain-containing protein [Candidatus Adiutrix sp.]